MFKLLKRIILPLALQILHYITHRFFLTLATGELLRYLSEVKNIVPPSSPANYTDENKCLRQLLVELMSQSCSSIKAGRYLWAPMSMCAVTHRSIWSYVASWFYAVSLFLENRRWVQKEGSCFPDCSLLHRRLKSGIKKWASLSIPVPPVVTVTVRRLSRCFCRPEGTMAQDWEHLRIIRFCFSPFSAKL